MTEVLRQINSTGIGQAPPSGLHILQDSESKDEGALIGYLSSMKNQMQFVHISGLSLFLIIWCHKDVTHAYASDF